MTVKDKFDATRSGYRGSNGLHSITAPRSTGAELSIARLQSRRGVPTTRLTYGGQSDELGCTTT